MFSKKDLEILSVEKKYQGFFTVNLFTLKHRLFNGQWSQPIQRELLDRGNASAVLAVDVKTSEVILTQQFRIGAHQTKHPWVLDVIAGMVETGESFEDVAIREALEEVGGLVNIEQKIASYYNSAGACSEMTTLYFGSIDSSALPDFGGCADENEDIKVVKMKFDKFFEFMKTDEIMTSSLVIAGLWLKSWLDQ